MTSTTSSIQSYERREAVQVFTTLLEAGSLWCISFAIILLVEPDAGLGPALVAAGVLGLIASYKITRDLKAER